MDAVTVQHATRWDVLFVLLMLALAGAICGQLVHLWAEEFARWRARRKARQTKKEARPSMSTDRVFVSAPVGRATVQAPWIVVDAPRDRQGREIVQ